MKTKEIASLRVLLKKASRPPARTKAQKAEHDAAVKRSRRDAYRAEALAAVQQDWDRRAAALRAAHGPVCIVHLGIGERPATYDALVNYHYERLKSRLNTT